MGTCFGYMKQFLTRDVSTHARVMLCNNHDTTNHLSTGFEACFTEGNFMLVW